MGFCENISAFHGDARCCPKGDINRANCRRLYPQRPSLGAQGRKETSAAKCNAGSEPHPKDASGNQSGDEDAHLLKREAAGAFPEAWPHGDNSARDANTEAAGDEPSMLGEDELAELAATEADGFHQAEFAAAFENVAGDYHGQAGAAEEQSQSAKRLKN